MLYHHAGRGPEVPSVGIFPCSNSIISRATLTQIIEHCRATRCGKESASDMRGSVPMSRDVQYLDNIGRKSSILTWRNLEST